MRVKRHRMGDTPTNRSWHKMRQRCNNPKATQWKWYGARGIRVCDRWNDPDFGFVRFVEDMGERPAGHTLDRINTDGHYEPGNCRWATHKQQILGQRKTIVVQVGGESVSVSEAARRLGVSATRIYLRLKRGLSAQEALDPRDLRLTPAPRYRSLIA